MKKLFIMGDSISIHYRPYLARMTKGIFSFEINEREKELAETNLDDPMGLNGGDSARVLGKLRDLSSGGLLDFDVMTLNCGLHDIKRDKNTGRPQVSLEDYRKNLEGILAALSAAKGKLFWVRCTPVEDDRHNSRASFDRFSADLESYNSAADKIMGAAGIPVIDLYTFTKNLPGEIFMDHIHYLEEVRAMQAAFIAGHIWNA